ncbi:MAG: hypothetical protein PHC43_00110 [Candidatus Marinimicrobia bacterium]|jgi:hypothetical protein|nr:hypothetical protein [Candidatus Neomarinimicrobiota bacterium]
MALIDYKNKGYVLIKKLSSSEQRELERIVNAGNYKEVGITLGQTFTRLESPKVTLKNIPLTNVVAFRYEDPPKSQFEEIPPKKRVHFTQTKIVQRPLTQEQREVAIERYAAELEKKGVSLDVLKDPELPRSKPPVTTTLRWVLAGQRNAALVDEYGVEQARKWGLTAFKVPHGLYSTEMAKNNEYIVYLSGNADKAKQVIKVLQKYPIGKRGPDFQREIGKALGQSDQVIEDRIRSIYGSAPKWLGVVAVAALLMLFFKAERL